jgi:hypothetical protein
MNLEVEHDENDKTHKQRVHLEASEVGMCLAILLIGMGFGLYFGLNCKFDK